jgi:RNA polymerase-binding protein DksA
MQPRNSMHPKTQEALARQLMRQRALLVGEVQDTEADLQFIQEDHETDFEERAQEEREARLLASLDDRSRQEIREIDAALRRMVEGTYGVCAGCGRRITVARLRALPATRFCLVCARAQELPPPPPAPEEVVRHPGTIPPDLRLLSDRELEAVIREQVKEDGRIDTEELRITCRHGVVYLAGTLPSEAEHSILRQLVTDTLGLEEVVDHVQVKELLWEREERTRDRTEEPLGLGPDETEDIIRSMEEGIEYIPPISPLPEEE